MSIRIARVIARLHVGGPARHVTGLSQAMHGGELETVLVTGTVPPGEDDMSGFARERGVTPVIIPEMSREISPRDAITIWKLFRFFRRYRPDIVHTHTAKAGTAARVAGFLYRWLALRPRRVKFVHTFHGHIFRGYYGRAKTRLFLLIEKTLARMTDVIIVLSEQQRREIHEDFGVGRRDQFRIIPLGIDLSELSSRAESRDLITVAIIGRLTAIKNHDLFLRVAARLRDLPQVRFVVYGDGTERAALESRAKQLGTPAVFAGTRPANEIYSSIDIAALTSLNEGTPLTLIEAMATGVPTISTAVGGVVDVLGAVQQRVSEDGAIYEIRERGITAASNDEAGFAAGLRRLVNDAALRDELAARGRAFAHATYSKERLIADMIALYRELGSYLEN